MSKTVVVTGAAGGIGRATVDVFHGEGWKTFAVDRSRAEEFPTGVEFHQADVSDPAAVGELFRWLRGKIERLDALVNNAAVQVVKPIVETTVEEWDAVMASNLRSIFLTAREGYPLLRVARGSIVNVSSVHAVATSADIAAYILGANFIERHFTLNRTWKGTDHSASLEPDGLMRLKRDLNVVRADLSYKEKEILDIETEQRKKLKRF